MPVIKCPKCGSKAIDERDGAEVGGFPGITYRVCPGCGWSGAITKKTPKRDLLKQLDKTKKEKPHG